MKIINGVDSQKRLVRIVLDKKEVPLIIKDIEKLKYEDTKYQSIEKFQYDKKIILDTPWDISTVLQNKYRKLSELVDYNLAGNGITDVNAKIIFTALRAKYKYSNDIGDNERSEKI